MSVKMLEKTVHFLNMDLAGDTLRRDIPRYQKQQFVRVLLNSRSQKLRKVHSNAPAPESFFNLQPITLMKKRSRHTYFFVNFAKFFRNNFVTEKHQRTDSERRILRKMANRHSYYKEIWKSTTLSKNRNYKGRCICVCMFSKANSLKYSSKIASERFATLIRNQLFHRYFKVFHESILYLLLFF